MNFGLFSAQLNEIDSILKKLCLFGIRINFPKYDVFRASDFRGKKYEELWNLSIDNELFDFRLVDNSLLQFRVNSFNPLNFSYCFLECPYEPKITFEEFYNEMVENGEEDPYHVYRLYEIYDVPSLKEVVTPLRYDFDPSSYSEGRHPASHMHFGHRNNIRICSKKVLLPLSFFFFVIRQNHPQLWIKFLESKDSEVLCRNIRENLENVGNKYWSRKDDFEMILS